MFTYFPSFSPLNFSYKKFRGLVQYTSSNTLVFSQFDGVDADSNFYIGTKTGSYVQNLNKWVWDDTGVTIPSYVYDTSVPYQVQCIDNSFLYGNSYNSIGTINSVNYPGDKLYGITNDQNLGLNRELKPGYVDLMHGYYYCIFDAAWPAETSMASVLTNAGFSFPPYYTLQNTPSTTYQRNLFPANKFLWTADDRSLDTSSESYPLEFPYGKQMKCFIKVDAVVTGYSEGEVNIDLVFTYFPPLYSKQGNGYFYRYAVPITIYGDELTEWYYGILYLTNTFFETDVLLHRPVIDNQFTVTLRSRNIIVGIYRVNVENVGVPKPMITTLYNNSQLNFVSYETPDVFRVKALLYDPDKDKIISLKAEELDVSMNKIIGVYIMDGDDVVHTSNIRVEYSSWTESFYPYTLRKRIKLYINNVLASEYNTTGSNVIAIKSSISYDMGDAQYNITLNGAPLPWSVARGFEIRTLLAPTVRKHYCTVTESSPTEIDNTSESRWFISHNNVFYGGATSWVTGFAASPYDHNIEYMVTNSLPINYI